MRPAAESRLQTLQLLLVTAQCNPTPGP